MKDQKTCSQCNTTKSIKEFHRYKRWFESSCNECRVTNKIRINQQFIMQYLLDKNCIDCGETDSIVLEFDHIGTKTGHISYMLGKVYTIERIKIELENCVTRCCNCHKIKTNDTLNSYRSTGKLASIKYRKRSVNQKYILTYLDEHPCVDCGNTDVRVLDFDHRNTKSDNVSCLIRDKDLNSVIAEIAKCDVRCGKLS